ncbi:MAG: hypothetical protein HY652_02065 [Acidobacteria bacterium]|nr:hypothetical protein [Acidobacteriota bacterium]
MKHHLFPGFSHVYYPRMSPLVEEFCRTHGYPYRRLCWGEAVVEAFLAFRTPKRVEQRLAALRLRWDPDPSMSQPCPHFGKIPLG